MRNLFLFPSVMLVTVLGFNGSLTGIVCRSGWPRCSRRASMSVCLCVCLCGCLCVCLSVCVFVCVSVVFVLEVTCAADGALKSNK